MRGQRRIDVNLTSIKVTDCSIQTPTTMTTGILNIVVHIGNELRVTSTLYLLVHRKVVKVELQFHKKNAYKVLTNQTWFKSLIEFHQ